MTAQQKRFRGLVLNPKMARYMLGNEFRRQCDGCGRTWHFKAMLRSATGPNGTTPTEYYCDGNCFPSLGAHLRASAEQVRSWPREEQRSQAIRGIAPPRHGRTDCTDCKGLGTVCAGGGYWLDAETCDRCGGKGWV